MADFSFIESPKWGVCLTCGTAANPDGFVDLIADTNIVREGYEIKGTVDVILCADCIEQVAALVGCSSREDSGNLGDSLNYYQEAYAKAADEAAAWQQRYENLVEIMSTLELREKNVDSDSNIEFMPAPNPSPDTRVQEGRAKRFKGTRKSK